MDSFLIGFLVGAAVLLLAYVATVLYRLDMEIGQMVALQKMMAVQQAKIQQISEATFQAAETFVDALRQSAEMMGPPNLSNLPPNTFDDLRQSFENGIREFEDTDEDEEEGT